MNKYVNKAKILHESIEHLHDLEAKKKKRFLKEDQNNINHKEKTFIKSSLLKLKTSDHQNISY